MVEKKYSYFRKPTSIWLKRSSVDAIAGVDAVLFDCDGVLIDVRPSYDKTILETVRFLAERLVGLHVPRNLPLRKAIHSLKMSGGFNNDWDVTYVLLVSLFTNLPSDIQKLLIMRLNSAETCNKLIAKRLGSLRKSVVLGEQPSALAWNSIEERILSLLEGADVSGVSSIEKLIVGDQARQMLVATKAYLSYPSEGSPLSRVFDEIFYGSELFMKKSGEEPRYYMGSGLVRKEVPIITETTFDKLVELFGSKKLGIVSGRDYASAKQTLGNLLGRFMPESLLFLIESEMDENIYRQGSVQLLKKPNPRVLLKGCRFMSSFSRVLYVGDSIEDLVMTKDANELDPRFNFAGVYAMTDFGDETRTCFMQKGADIILPTVNDLPDLLFKLRKEKE